MTSNRTTGLIGLGKYISSLNFHLNYTFPLSALISKLMLHVHLLKLRNSLFVSWKFACLRNPLPCRKFNSKTATPEPLNFTWSSYCTSIFFLVPIFRLITGLGIYSSSTDEDSDGEDDNIKVEDHSDWEPEHVLKVIIIGDIDPLLKCWF